MLQARVNMDDAWDALVKADFDVDDAIEDVNNQWGKLTSAFFIDVLC